MDKATRLRWAILLCAFAGTVVAIFYPDNEDAPQPAHSVANNAKTSAAVSAHPVDVASADNDVVGDPDPFAPRGWQAPPPAPAPVSVNAAIASVAPVPAPPAGPPPLPFRFVGSMNDGGDQLVYLGRGDEALVARNGDVLENTYKVTSITASQIEFEHLPTGQKQALAFPARDN